MTAAEYYGRVGRIQREIIAKLDRVEEMESLINRCTTVISDMPGFHDPSKREKQLAALIDMKREVLDIANDLALTEWEIRAMIKQLSDDRQREVLERYYINQESLDGIADALGIKVRQVQRIKADALKESESTLRKEGQRDVW